MANLTPANQTDEELLAEVREFATTASSANSNMMTRIAGDLAFVGGEQYDSNDEQMMGPGRAKRVFNLTRNYCNQLINAFRQKPFGIVLSPRRSEAKDKSIVTQGIIRGIESKCDATSAYAVAVDRQVKCGRGYVVVSTDYSDEDGWEQEIKIEGVIRPEMVIWDPWSKEVAGKDATRCAFVEHISKAKSKEDFPDVDTSGSRSVDGLLADTNWKTPADSVEVLTYFRLKKLKTKIYQDEEGNTLPQDQVRKNSKMKSRNTTKTSVEVIKIVSRQVVSRTEFKMTRLPVIPFLGEMIDRDRTIDWAGLVYFAKDPAKLVNGMASLTAERIALSPKATQYVDMRSISNYKDIWQQSNRLSLAYLPYDSTVPGSDQVFSAPTPRDVQVQITDVTTAQQTYQQTLGSVLGIAEAGSMAAAAANETAASVLTRSRSGDISNFQYSDNAAKSIKAVGRVLLELIPIIYDTPRMLPVGTAQGIQLQEIDVAELGLVASEYEVDVDAGPMAATQRKEELAALIAFGTMLGPEIALSFASNIAKAADFAESDDIAEILKAVAKSKLGVGGDGEQDPEAVAALEEADKTIQNLQGQLAQTTQYLGQVQAELQSQKDFVEMEKFKALLDRSTKLDVEAMKKDTVLTQQQAQIQADAEAEARKAGVDLAKKQMELDAKAKQVDAQSSLVAPPMASLGKGMGTDIFQQNAELM